MVRSLSRDGIIRSKAMNIARQACTTYEDEANESLILDTKSKYFNAVFEKKNKIIAKIHGEQNNILIKIGSDIFSLLHEAPIWLGMTPLPGSLEYCHF